MEVGAKVVYQFSLGKEGELSPTALTRGNCLFPKVGVELPARAPDTGVHTEVGLPHRAFPEMETPRGFVNDQPAASRSDPDWGRAADRHSTRLLFGSGFGFFGFLFFFPVF